MATILLVDDVYTARSLLERVLRLIGRYEVLAASSGQEAVRVALETAPDLVVLDVMMPGLDGFATLWALRAHGITCPVLAYTARSEQVPGEFVQGGFSAYLLKNGDLSSLLTTVRELLGKSIAASPLDTPDHDAEAPPSLAPDSPIDKELQEREIGGEA
ncbi:MAG: response regulator [Chloroflexaceae bacterium]